MDWIRSWFTSASLLIKKNKRRPQSWNEGNHFWRLNRWREGKNENFLSSSSVRWSWLRIAGDWDTQFKTLCLFWRHVFLLCFRFPKTRHWENPGSCRINTEFINMNTTSGGIIENNFHHHVSVDGGSLSPLHHRDTEGRTVRWDHKPRSDIANFFRMGKYCVTPECRNLKHDLSLW